MRLLDLIRRPEPVPEPGVAVKPMNSLYFVVDSYFVREPHSVVKLVKSDSLGEGLHYFALEDPLTPEEQDTYDKIVKILSKELVPPTGEGVDPKAYVLDQAQAVAERYHRSLGEFDEAGWNRIFYHVVKDLVGYGPMQVIMDDPAIEDISCNGVNTPVFIWHRKFESIPTNIAFTSEIALNDFLIKLAHRSGKHISSAQPLLDGMLPEKHRLAATFMHEVSAKGSTFTIRKFREDPLSIIDLITWGTLDEAIAAYFWMILEHKLSFMIIGGTGAGKTSLLNATLTLMSGNDKIITVEEVPELRPGLPNWTQLHTRQSFQFSAESPKGITLFDLIKVCLRYRPDYIVVGEVRGEEAYTLFQALATGHGGLCTMHADSLDRVVKRLTSPPMNVAEVYIPLMNSAMHVQKVELPYKKNGLSFGRRVRTVWEIEDFNVYREVSKWDPATDTFSTFFENSLLLERIAAQKGLPLESILAELEERQRFLGQLVSARITDHRKVTEKILAYYQAKTESKRESAPTPEPAALPSPVSTPAKKRRRRVAEA